MIGYWPPSSYNGAMQHILSLLAAVVVVLPVEQAAARRAGNQIAIVVLPQGGANAKLTTAIADHLVKAAGERALAGKALKKALKRKPEVTAAKCAANPGCLAKLGRQARASEVLLARVMPAGDGVKVEVLVLNVESQAIERKVAFEVESLGSVAARVAEKEAELWGAPAAPSAAGEDELSLAMIEATPLAQAATAEPATAAPTPEPALAPPPAPVGAAAPADAMADLELTALPTKPTPSPAATEGSIQVDALSVPSRSHTLTYAGLGLAGAGAIGLGLGVVYGMKSRSLPDTIERGGSGTTMEDGIAIYDDAERAARRANLFFAVGSAASMVGAVLVGVDLLVLDDAAGSGAHVEVGATPNGAWVRYAW